MNLESHYYASGSRIVLSLVSMNFMRRYSSVALVSSMLVFTGLFLGDFFCWTGFYDQFTNPPRTCSAYQFIRDGSFEKGVECTEPSRRWQKTLVMSAGMLLDWLAFDSDKKGSRGEIAVQLSLLGGFCCYSGVLLVDILEKRRKMAALSGPP